MGMRLGAANRSRPDFLIESKAWLSYVVESGNFTAGSTRRLLSLGSRAGMEIAESVGVE